MKIEDAACSAEDLVKMIGIMRTLLSDARRQSEISGSVDLDLLEFQMFAVLARAEDLHEELAA